jgi:hypothetical protein
MKKGDIIIILSLIIISLVTSGFIIGKSINTKSEFIVVSVENKVVKKVPINLNETYDFKFGKNTGFIEVKDKAVRMLEMDKNICPESICSDTGWISKNHQSIVCLPNKIVVSFETNQDSQVDGTVY